MSEFTYGWKSLLAATIGTMCGIFTLTNYTQGFFVGPVTSEFGWSAPQFFLSYTVLMCSGLLTGPLIGFIAQKVGLRTVGIIGLIGHSLAYVVLSLNNGSLMLWYLSWALVAILGAGSLPIIWTGVLNNWFSKHRGKAIGITMAGTGLGAFLLPPIVEFLIANHGWRTAYRGIGLGALCVSLPIVLALFKENIQGEMQWMSGENLWLMFGLVCLTMGIMYGLPKLTKKIPAALVAIVIVVKVTIMACIPPAFSMHITTTTNVVRVIISIAPAIAIAMVPRHIYLFIKLNLLIYINEDY